MICEKDKIIAKLEKEVTDLRGLLDKKDKEITSLKAKILNLKGCQYMTD